MTDDKRIPDANFLAAAAAVDAAFVDEALGDYPSSLASVPPKQLRVLAVQGAMLAVRLARELPRHNPVVSELIAHVALDVRPAAWAAAKR